MRSSQVGRLNPEMGPRWDTTRRMETVLALLEKVEPGDLITHRLPFHRAPEAYPLLDASMEEAVQVVFTYGRIGEGRDV